MKQLVSKLSISCSVRFLCFLGCGMLTAAQASTSQTVTLSPGDDIQSAVTAAPAGTTFVLLAGLYRMQSVQPKIGDIFKGQGTVILNGSQVLSFQIDPAGTGLWTASASVNTTNHGGCQTARPMCGYVQDLFIDNVLQTPAQSLSGLTSGSWYFDRTHGNVYIPGNPAGHTVELGMKQYAFYGSAASVQISNIVVEKYAAPAQYGAVGGNSAGTSWIVKNVEARWNHGRGISLGSGSQIANCFVHHNGQLGISLYGTNSQATANEISWNNYAGFNAQWEAGGSKFWATTNLLVKSNYVHDNYGPGLWTDTDNVGTIYDSNTVINNLNEGIKHEVSYNAIIRNNIVKGNGTSSTVWLWNSQIEVQNSSSVEVYGNTVEVQSGSGNGIGLINQKRGSGTQGSWVAANNYVHGNTVTYLGKNGVSGLVDDTGGSTAVGNRFDSNHYITPDGGATRYHWIWLPAKGYAWTGFQTMGQEQNGDCCH